MGRERKEGLPKYSTSSVYLLGSWLSALPLSVDKICKDTPWHPRGHRDPRRPSGPARPPCGDSPAGEPARPGRTPRKVRRPGAASGCTCPPPAPPSARPAAVTAARGDNGEGTRPQAAAFQSRPPARPPSPAPALAVLHRGCPYFGGRVSPAQTASSQRQDSLHLRIRSAGHGRGRAPRAARLTCVSHGRQRRAGHIAHKRRPKAEEVGVRGRAAGAPTVELGEPGPALGGRGRCNNKESDLAAPRGRSPGPGPRRRPDGGPEPGASASPPAPRPPAAAHRPE